MQHLRRLFLLSLVWQAGGLLAGCQVFYDGSQQNALQACERFPDREQRNDCVRRHQMPYDQYEKARQELMPAPPSATEAPKPRGDLCFIRSSTGERVCPN